MTRELNDDDVGLLLAGQSTPDGVRLMPPIRTPNLPKQSEPEKPK